MTGLKTWKMLLMLEAQFWCCFNTLIFVMKSSLIIIDSKSKIFFFYVTIQKRKRKKSCGCLINIFFCIGEIVEVRMVLRRWSILRLDMRSQDRIHNCFYFCPIGRLVDKSVGLYVCQIFHKSRQVTISWSYRQTFYSSEMYGGFHLTLVGLEDKDGPWIICDSFIRDWEKDILHIYHIYIHHSWSFCCNIHSKSGNTEIDTDLVTK